MTESSSLSVVLQFASRIRAVTVVVGAAALAVCIVACAGEADEAGEPGVNGRGVYIPSHWQATRDVEGHRVHVVEEKISCSSCHELTDKEIGPVSPEACAECHEKESAISHAKEDAHERFGPGVNADCRGCHIFTLQITDDGPHTAVDGPYEAKDCLRCHESPQADIEPVVVHRPAECLSCHQPHDQTQPVSAPCGECHEEVHTTHAAAGKSASEACTTCHESLHSPASAAIETCGTCHESNEPIVPSTAVFEEGHRECIGCHRPHDFEKTSAVDCHSCHEEKPVLAEARVAAHRNCTSCHNPHDVKAASATACSGCHKDVSPNHPKHGKAGTCTGCHDPHPANRSSTKVRDCSSCHHEAPHDDSFHEGVECRSCHAPHKFMLENAGPTLCSQCHSDNVQLVSTHQGHQDCSSCHAGLPHRPTRMNASCSSCHQDVHQEARRGHKNCQSCHDPHGTQMISECGDCHLSQQRSVPKGHSDCTSCHDQHSGSHSETTCSSCHREVARSPHGKLDADCSSCHTPHNSVSAARPPDCSSCHKDAKLPGLHQITEHVQRCSTCHTGHGEEIQPQRPVCLSCHQDQVKHFPKGATCSSCHLFSPTK